MADILVVTTGSEAATAMATLLRGDGHTVNVALGLKPAVAWLSSHAPDLLISAIRLGDYNGLHLVLRSQTSHPEMRTILLDHAHDSTTEAEAKRYGAWYLAEPVDGTELLAQVSLALIRGNHPRRWPRKRSVEGMLAQIERRLGHVVDLSYGGLSFDLPQGSDVPAQFAVTLPAVGLAFQAKPVWVRRVPSGGLSCGAELLDPSPMIVDSWRRLVDGIPDRI